MLLDKTIVPCDLVSLAKMKQNYCNVIYNNLCDNAIIPTEIIRIKIEMMQLVQLHKGDWQMWKYVKNFQFSWWKLYSHNIILH